MFLKKKRRKDERNLVVHVIKEGRVTSKSKVELLYLTYLLSE